MISKAEKHELIKPKEALEKTIKKACSKKDKYDVAASLLEGINRGHFFGSANKRTSYIVTQNFLKNNNEKVTKKTSDEEARFLLKVRKGEVSKNKIKRWLKS